MYKLLFICKICPYLNYLTQRQFGVVERVWTWDQINLDFKLTPQLIGLWHWVSYITPLDRSILINKIDYNNTYIIKNL